MFVRNVLSFLSNVIPISYKGDKYVKKQKEVTSTYNCIYN